MGGERPPRARGSVAAAVSRPPHALAPSWTSGRRHARAHVLLVVSGHPGDRPSRSASPPPSCTTVPSAGTGGGRECPRVDVQGHPLPAWARGRRAGGTADTAPHPVRGGVSPPPLPLRVVPRAAKLPRRASRPKHPWTARRRHRSRRRRHGHRCCRRHHCRHCRRRLCRCRCPAFPLTGGIRRPQPQQPPPPPPPLTPPRCPQRDQPTGRHHPQTRLIPPPSASTFLRWARASPPAALAPGGCTQ